MVQATGLRALIVDDNADAAESLAFLLTYDGADARIERDARRIVEVMHAFDPLLILMDLELPGIDGYEACKLIRRERGSDVYVAALTGWSRPEDFARTQQAGFDAHVVKPISTDRLKQLGDLAEARRKARL
jgi:CheY-like chemotaxis protein